MHYSVAISNYWKFYYTCFLLSSLLQLAIAISYGREMLQRAHLRASAFEFAPLFIKKKIHGNISYEGTMVDLLILLSDHFNFTLEYIESPELDIVGGGTACANQLINKEVDISPYPFEQTLEYSQIIDLSIPILISDYILMQPYPKEKSRLSAPIRPFNATVWCGVIATIFAFIGVTTTIAMFRERRMGDGDNIKKKPKDSFWKKMSRQWDYTMSIICLQGNYISYTASTSLRLFVGIWLLMMTVLIYAYTGLLTACLTVPRLEPIINTFEQLAGSHKYFLIMEKNSEFTNEILKEKSGIYEIFGDQFRQNPDLLFIDFYKAVDGVAKKKCCAYAGPIEFVNILMAGDLKASDGKCRMTKGSKLLPYFISYSAGFPKGSPYRKILNEQFYEYLWENGIVDQLKRKYAPDVKQCQVGSVKRSGRMASFKMVDFTGVWFLLVVGIGSSTVIFILENLFFVWQKKRSNI